MMIRQILHRSVGDSRRLLTVLLLAAFAHWPSVAAAQTAYDIVASFPVEGVQPGAALLQASDGSFYGTTLIGGAYGVGTVFRMDLAGQVITLHSFSGPDGRNPGAELILGNDGAFYGTTRTGGTEFVNASTPGSGTIFRIDAGGTVTTLHSLRGTEGGPSGRLLQAADGAFYGVTRSGGAARSRGTIFKLDRSGTFSTLHEFTDEEGTLPQWGLIQASDGNFYGTTTSGGATPGRDQLFGTVFKVDAAGTLTRLFTFTNATNGAPSSSLIQGSDGSFYGTTARSIFKIDSRGTLTTLAITSGINLNGVMQAPDGTLYGTTESGAASNQSGTVFSLDASGTLTTLHTFTGFDGARPLAGLVHGQDGNFYGTTAFGGATFRINFSGGEGTVFKIDAAGTLTTLHDFRAFGTPRSGVIQSTDGRLYGTTRTAAFPQNSTLFAVDPSQGVTTTLFTFIDTPSDDGLIRGADGFLYGTTCGSVPLTGAAISTIYSLDATDLLTTIRSWTPACATAGLLQALDGNFYGTTTDSIFRINSAGQLTVLRVVNGATSLSALTQGVDRTFYGTVNQDSSTTTPGGPGSVFKITEAGAFTTLHSFSGPDGASPRGRLVQGSDGRFYGVTSAGGAAGLGTVYALDAAGALTTLHAFNGLDGAAPGAGLLQASDGYLYGTTYSGGAFNDGTIFRIDLSGNFTTLKNLRKSSGASPSGPLFETSDGNVYGTTIAGGPLGGGVVFRLRPGQGPPNRAPLAVGDAYTLDADNTLVVAGPGVLGNDRDEDGDALTVVGGGGVLHGHLTLDPTGSFIYTPAAGYSGTDSFTYQASDGTDVSAVTTVTLTVVPRVPTMVTSVSPAAGATAVPLVALIKATFSRPMMAATLTTSTVSLQAQGSSTPVAATVSYDAATRTVILFPAAMLTGSTLYTATIAGGDAGVKDLAGISLAASVWSFTTADGTGNSTVYLSDLPGTTIANGWGPVERDRSNGGINAGDGGPITLDGVTYAKGLGVNARSELRYALGGACLAFTAMVGVDDEVAARGSIVFQVWTDGVKQYDSGLMTGATATRRVNVNVTDASDLRLIVTNGGDDATYDHGDWADAQLTCLGVITLPTITNVSDLTWTSATNGWGPVEKDRSNGDLAAGDGRPLTLNGVTYARGLGVHAPSDVRYALGGACTTFTALIGIDDEVRPNGSVVFQVWTDGVKRYEEVAYGTIAPYHVSVDVTGASELALMVTQGPDNASYDHADWAEPQLTCGGGISLPTTTSLSDRSWATAINGWGPVEKDQSNGDLAAGDGSPLTLNGMTYMKGLGVHAPSDLRYTLGGMCSTITALIGVDDEVGPNGSIVFQVWTDGVKKYDSGLMTGDTASRDIRVDVTGASELALIVTDGGDGAEYDHGDWAAAQVSCGTASAARVRKRTN
jgi:uncharacterized repeat protein (TIGR03803 family)